MGVSLMGSKGHREFFGQYSFIDWRLSKGLKWTTASFCSLLVACVGLLPAVAEELSAWRYDSRSRSLTLTLLGAATPSVSVTAPNQLLVELPNTQLGDVRAQRVNDGFVEHIALEQATPETVWMVVDFVPGTVLADTQQAMPLATSSNAIQLWKVEPTLMASRRAVDAAIASTNSESGAAALATPSTQRDIAQADFPNLPILEPAVPQNQTVVVPPINAAPAQLPESAAPAVDIPVIESDVVETALPIIVEPAGNPLAAESLASESSAPPFIGEVDTAIAIETVPARPSQPAATAQTVEEVADSRFEPSARSRTESNLSDFRTSELEAPADSAQAPSRSRWPEPIPFGQPLP